MPIHAGLSVSACAARRLRRGAETRLVPKVSFAPARPESRFHSLLSRLAHEVGGLSGWRRYGLAFLLGVTAVATLPPVDMSPLLIVAFPGLFWLDEGSSGSSASFGLGYAFGF